MNGLRRELRLFDATMLGLGSILGTGVFVSLGLAAGLVDAWVVPAVVLAGLVATCNALSTAQLAAAYPTSGGSYEYGYRLLHPVAGFTAGWMFLWAKGASAAAAALGFGGYVLSAFGWAGRTAHLALALGAVAALTLLAAGGIRRSAAANAAIVGVTLVALAALVVAGAATAVERWPAVTGPPNPAAFFEAVALAFVAYTGYGRVATLAEEVNDPRRTIPRAVIATLVVTGLVYVAVVAVGVGTVGGAVLSQAAEAGAAPLEAVARAIGAGGLPALVAVGAVTAMLGVLLNLILGLSRVLLAMGRRGDMPSAVTTVHQTRSTPVVAVYVVGVAIMALAATGDIRVVWSFSAFTVLIYYAIANLSALRLPPGQRLFPRSWALGGLGGCVFLAFWVDVLVWVAGLAVIALGIGWHLVARRVGAAGR